MNVSELSAKTQRSEGSEKAKPALTGRMKRVCLACREQAAAQYDVPLSFFDRADGEISEQEAGQWGNQEVRKKGGEA